jgi:tetratricopeptide (TPR) repeat protein
LLDLALLWTDLQVRRASPGAEAAARQEALRTLAEAEALCGPSPVLDCERQQHALALGDTAAAQEAGQQAASRAARTAWEHYALGRSLLRTATAPGCVPSWERAATLALAAAALDRAVELEPQALWPHFHYGLCASHLGRHEEAVHAFTACIALSPQFAAAYHNRARAQAALHRTDQALRDYDHALQYGAPPAGIHYGRALVYQARQDRRAALASVRRALEHDPGHTDARALQAHLLANPEGTTSK